MPTRNFHTIEYQITIHFSCKYNITETDKPSVKRHIIDAIAFTLRESPQPLPLNGRISILLRQSK